MENSVNNKNINDEFLKHFNLPMQFISSDAITNTYYNYERIESIAKWIDSRVHVKPLTAIICGSGLGEIADLVENRIIIPYTDIPDFPRSTVHGHKGNLVFGYLSELPVICMQGRFHPFEGYSLALCTMPIKVFKLLGVKLIILTNASGGINKSYNVGDLMVIKDHISFPLFSLSHPLIGPNDDRFGPRFLALNKIYKKNLRDLFLNCGKELNMKLHEGVYGSIGGPTYESPTDSRWCITAGMDSVGMSTTHEAVVALHCGMNVLAFSIITDKVHTEYDIEDHPDHEEIIKVAAAKAKQAEKLVAHFLEKIHNDRSYLD